MASKLSIQSLNISEICLRGTSSPRGGCGGVGGGRERERERANDKLEPWRKASESHGFHSVKTKTKYMECKFSKARTSTELEVEVRDHTIIQLTQC